MTTGKVITGVAVGAVIALLVIPKTRKMITDAISNLSDSLKDFASEAQEFASKTTDMAAQKAESATHAAMES